jgi:hypothetical protein
MAMNKSLLFYKIKNELIRNKNKVDFDCNPPGMSIFSAGSSQPNFASKKNDTNRKNGIDAIVGKSMER